MGTVLLGKEACGTHDDEEEDAENKRGGAPHPRSKHAQDGHWVNRRKKLLQATSEMRTITPDGTIWKTKK